MYSVLPMGGREEVKERGKKIVSLDECGKVIKKDKKGSKKTRTQDLVLKNTNEKQKNAQLRPPKKIRDK